MSVYRFSDPSTKLTILIRASGTKITPINGATSVFESEAIDDPKLIFDAFDLLLIRTEDPLVFFFKKKIANARWCCTKYRISVIRTFVS